MGFNLEFSNWVKEELEKKHWSQAELSRKSGLSTQAIGGMLNLDRMPGPDMCNGIARAFNLPASEVFIRAGLMEPERSRSPLDQEICHKVTLLTSDQKEILLAEIDGIINLNQT